MKRLAQQLFCPGLLEFKQGRRWLGIIGLIFTAMSWIFVIVMTGIGLINMPALAGFAVNDRGLMFVVMYGAVFAIVVAILGVREVLRGIALRKKPAQKWLAGIMSSLLVALQVAVLAAGANTAWVQREFVNSITTHDSDQAGFDDDSSQTLQTSEGRVNVLLLGGDAGADRYGLRPDSISVLSVNAETGATTIIGIPRNLQKVPFAEGSPLWGPYPDGFDCESACLINALYTYGNSHPELFPGASNPGMQATIDAVEGVTGLKIQYTILVDMQAFSGLVDAVGGVEVCVPNATQSKDGSYVFAAGCQRMDGVHALAYSRIRSDSDDYNRMEKQRLVQQALIKQIGPLQLITGYQQIAQTGTQYVQTTIPSGALPGLVSLATLARSQPVNTLELVPPAVITANPDFAAIREMIIGSLK